MKKFPITDYKKGLIFSLVLHLGLLLVVFSTSQDKATPPQAKKLVTLSLNSFSLPQKVVEVQKPLQKPTEVVKPKPPVKKQKELCKTKPLAKKHFKKEAPIKEEVTKEEETKEEISKEEVLTEEFVKETIKEETQPVQEPTQTLAQNSEPVATTASLEEEFAQTNFEILRALILENLKYPHMAKRMNQTGIVKLMLVINAQGKLIDITLENSSGHKLLDKSALKAAKYLADLDLPVPHTTSRIVLPIAFSLN